MCFPVSPVAGSHLHLRHEPRGQAPDCSRRTSPSVSAPLFFLSDVGATRQCYLAFGPRASLTPVSPLNTLSTLTLGTEAHISRG